jgi:hypothetical protein
VLWSAAVCAAGCASDAGGPGQSVSGPLHCDGQWWLVVTPVGRGGTLEVGQTAQAEASYFWTRQDGGACNRAVTAMKVTVTVPGIVSIKPASPGQAPNLAFVVAEKPGEITFGAEITLKDGSKKMDEFHQTIVVVPATMPN